MSDKSGGRGGTVVNVSSGGGMLSITISSYDSVLDAYLQD